MDKPHIVDLSINTDRTIHLHYVYMGVSSIGNYSLEHIIKFGHTSIIDRVFEAANVPDDLTYKEKIAYFQLLGKD